MLMLLDSAGLYYRAFHGAPESITAPDGTPVNAVRGFLDMTAALVASRRPSDLVACWDDDWRPQWRVDLLPTYKAHRAESDGSESEPESLGRQVQVIVEVLAALGVSRIGSPGYEADDVMATLARRYAARGVPVEVVTGDRDLLQLVDDTAGIRVLYVGRGIRRVEVLDEAAVRARHGVDPQQYADMSILRGDPSDGLPGIPGIGARTAAGLLERFGSLRAIREAVSAGAPGIRPGVAAALRDGADYLDRAERVVLAAEAPVPDIDPRLPVTAADPVALDVLAQQWGLSSPIARLRDAIDQARRPQAPAAG